MKRVFAALFGTVTGLVLLLDFKTHPASVASVPVATSPLQPTGTTSAGAPGASKSGRSAAGKKSATSAKPATKPASKAPKSGTYTGAAVQTIFGPVQVQITVTGGRLTQAQAVIYPNNTPQDQQINGYAIPQLNQEAVAAGSARIDMVSGATYTSTGYLQSLQSALDKVGK